MSSGKWEVGMPCSEGLLGWGFLFEGNHESHEWTRMIWFGGACWEGGSANSLALVDAEGGALS